MLCPLMINILDTNIFRNILLPEGVTERKKALFIFKLYRGFDIIKMRRGTSVIEDNIPENEMTDLEKSNLPDVGIKISFAGLSVIKMSKSECTLINLTIHRANLLLKNERHIQSGTKVLQYRNCILHLVNVLNLNFSTSINGRRQSM